jgi:hypothetical protein
MRPRTRQPWWCWLLAGVCISGFVACSTDRRVIDECIRTEHASPQHVVAILSRSDLTADIARIGITTCALRHDRHMDVDRAIFDWLAEHG